MAHEAQAQGRGDPRGHPGAVIRQLLLRRLLQRGEALDKSSGALDSARDELAELWHLRLNSTRGTSLPYGIA